MSRRPYKPDRWNSSLLTERNPGRAAGNAGAGASASASASQSSPTDQVFPTFLQPKPVKPLSPANAPNSIWQPAGPDFFEQSRLQTKMRQREQEQKANEATKSSHSKENGRGKLDKGKAQPYPEFYGYPMANNGAPHYNPYSSGAYFYAPGAVPAQPVGFPAYTDAYATQYSKGGQLPPPVLLLLLLLQQQQQGPATAAPLYPFNPYAQYGQFSPYGQFGHRGFAGYGDYGNYGGQQGQSESGKAKGQSSSPSSAGKEQAQSVTLPPIGAVLAGVPTDPYGFYGGYGYPHGHGSRAPGQGTAPLHSKLNYYANNPTMPQPHNPRGKDTSNGRKR